MVDSAYSSGLKDAFPAIGPHQSSDLARRLVPNGKELAALRSDFLFLPLHQRPVKADDFPHQVGGLSVL